MGDIWSNIIENNILKCDIFVVIVTQASLRSIEIEKEVLQAQRENRKIIPCIHRDVRHAEIKWDLARLQGIEFDDKYELARKLFSKIERSSPIIPQTQSQPESLISQKQEAPPTTPQQQSESLVPPAATAASSIRSSPPLSYSQADSTNTNTNTNTSPPARSTTPSTDESRHYYHQEAIEDRRSGINLKILLPIIGVVAIVGAVVAFSFLVLRISLLIINLRLSMKKLHHHRQLQLHQDSKLLLISREGLVQILYQEQATSRLRLI